MVEWMNIGLNPKKRVQVLCHHSRDRLGAIHRDCEGAWCIFHVIKSVKGCINVGRGEQVLVGDGVNSMQLNARDEYGHMCGQLESIVLSYSLVGSSSNAAGVGEVQGAHYNLFLQASNV